MILSALARKKQGATPRFGPAAFPEVDFGPSLRVPTPAEGGDGKALAEVRPAERGGIRSVAGTMTTREEALRSHGKLTTDLDER